MFLRQKSHFYKHCIGVLYITAVVYAYTFDALNAADSSVDIEVTGAIPPYCANSAVTSPVSIDDIRKPGVATVAFTVDCNAPFQYSMQSAHGAMRLPHKSDAHTIPYSVRIRIPLTRGGAIDDMCESASLRAGAVTCKFTDSGGKIALNERGMAEVTWSTPVANLFLGQYKDIITFFITLKY
jgi:hypothetical protein